MTATSPGCRCAGCDVWNPRGARRNHLLRFAQGGCRCRRLEDSGAEDDAHISGNDSLPEVAIGWIWLDSGTQFQVVCPIHVLAGI